MQHALRLEEATQNISSSSISCNSISKGNAKEMNEHKKTSLNMHSTNAADTMIHTLYSIDTEITPQTLTVNVG